MAPHKTLGVFGHAEFSARGPRPRFRAILMIFGGSKILEKNPGQANYSDASVLGAPQSTGGLLAPRTPLEEGFRPDGTSRIPPHGGWFDRKTIEK